MIKYNLKNYQILIIYEYKIIMLMLSSSRYIIKVITIGSTIEHYRRRND